MPAYRAVANHLMAHDGNPLAAEEWTIEDIGGGGVIDNSHVTLHFLSDGRLAGSATCNRMIGSYKADGGKLSIQNPGATMMACSEALMKQEQKLLKLLRTVQSYRIDKTDALVLTTRDKKAIVARRP